MRRELLLHVPAAEEGHHKIKFQSLLDGVSKIIELEDWSLFQDSEKPESETNVEFALFRQKNPKLSRKKIQPALDDVLRKIHNDADSESHI